MTRPRLADPEVITQAQTKQGRKHRQYWNEKENDARQYWYPLTPEGEPDQVVFSVTTILKEINKPGIPQWYANAVAARAAQNPEALFTRTEGEAYNYLRWAGTHELKAAGERGDKIHSFIEHDLGGTKPDPGFVDEDDLQMQNLWLDLRWNREIDPLHLEVTAWSHKHGYAGTIDGIGYIDGKLTMWDVKSSRNIWDEHKEQLAALGNADELLIEVEPLVWQKLDMPEIEQYAIIRIRPDDVDHKGNFVPGFWEILTFSIEEINEYFPTFLGALQVKMGRENTKKFKKKKED